MVAPGILLVDKPGGLTSHDVVARTRKAFGTRKIGHAGTLDPMATGLLVLGIEGATRLLTYVVGADKTYVATIRLGQATGTDDAEGEITRAADAADVDAVEGEQIRAGIAALDQGESFVEHQIARAKRGRQIVLDALLATGAVDLPAPAGAFYAFPMVHGVTDSVALAIRLIDEAGVGLAPGSGFGPGGEGGLRICYARKAEDLEEAMRRIAPVLVKVARGD